MECAATLSVTAAFSSHRATYCLGDKDRQRPCFAEDSLRLDSGNHAVDLRIKHNLSDMGPGKHKSKSSYRFALEGFPKNCAVKYDKCGFSRSWHDFAR